MRVPSLAERLSELTTEERKDILDALPRHKRQRMQYNWKLWARPEQLPPAGQWRIWLILSGRGWGKSRTGSEWVQANHAKYGRMHLVGRTAGDIRDTMVDGVSGILRIAPPWDRPHYSPTKKRLTWNNGAMAVLFSSDEPESLRGPQCEAFWADETASWKYIDETWDQLMMGWRIGDYPRGIVTTTPKPIKLIRRLMQDTGTYVTRGATYDNIANLAPSFIDSIIKPYEGTRLGRQELLGEIVDDIQGALWQQTTIHDHRRDREDKLPPMERIVVAIDPATTSTAEDGGETGILVAGRGEDGHTYILADLTCKASPDGWARQSILAYHTHKADRVIGEVNQGGDLVETVLRTVDPEIPYSKVFASRGKVTRAEPVAALYEQGKVHHVGIYPQLEEELTTWVPGMKSPNRLDACVWAITELMLGSYRASTLDLDLDLSGRESPWAI